MDEQPEQSKNSGCCSRCSRCCNCCGRCCICGVDEETKQRNNWRNWQRAFGLLGMLAVLVGCTWYVASYYGIIILNFTFFYVTLIMYIIVPVRAVMSSDWKRAGFGLLQVFCYAPYIQFFLYFLICSVSTVTGTIPVVIELLLTGKLFRSLVAKMTSSPEKQNGNASQTEEEASKEQESVYSGDNEGNIARVNCLVSFGWVVVLVIIAGMACLGLYTSEKYPVRQWFMCLLGLGSYLLFLAEMAVILICVYENCKF